MFAFIFVWPHFNFKALIILYQIFIFLYYAGVRIAALWNPKAQEWIKGRKNLIAGLPAKINLTQPAIWVHAASAGEFEQAKPVIESLKEGFPHYQIIVSFFSPSGFKAARNYKHADTITYLPLDTKRNAAAFLDAVKPILVIFSKYDFWYYHLKEIHKRNIPLLLISSVFRPYQAFFKWYGGFYKKILHFFTHIFVQDAASLQLLKAHSIQHCSISGDTRFDRVDAIKKNFTDIPFIEEFIADNKTIVAGSTWASDEKLLSDYLNASPIECKLIIAPHEITPENLARIQQLFNNSILYSDCKNSLSQQRLQHARVLIIDNVGMLSRLYYYATISYVGGGFTKSGIHNILEAAVYGKPVIIGTNYEKYAEAVALVQQGGAFSIADNMQLQQILKNLFQSQSQYTNASNASASFVAENIGATHAIVTYIQANRLLTN